MRAARHVLSAVLLAAGCSGRAAEVAPDAARPRDATPAAVDAAPAAVDAPPVARPDAPSSGPGDAPAGGRGDAAPDAGGSNPDARMGSGGDAAPAPTLASDFAADDGLWTVRHQPDGRVELGAAHAAAADGRAARLLLAGDPALGPADRVGPRFATELRTRERLHYGTYRARLSLAACAAGEDVVNGIFTYFNDGSDEDGDGLADNSEIDIEILCGTPTYVLLTSWTDYQESPEEFRKWSRAIDLATGEILESPSDREYGLVRVGQDPAFVRPRFPEAGALYEMGFEWGPDRLRFFLVLDGEELTLWLLTDARYISPRPAYWMFNVWHPASHWFGDGGEADYPARDAEVYVDWARHWRAP